MDALASAKLDALQCASLTPRAPDWAARFIAHAMQDVRLVANGREYLAHKLILSMRCAALLSERPCWSGLAQLPCRTGDTEPRGFAHPHLPQRTDDCTSAQRSGQRPTPHLPLAPVLASSSVFKAMFGDSNMRESALHEVGWPNPPGAAPPCAVPTVWRTACRGPFACDAPDRSHGIGLDWPLRRRRS